VHAFFCNFQIIGSLIKDDSIFYMQAIYLLSNPNGTMKLYEFVIIFGCFMLILAQLPSFHSLRHINLVSLILCLAYSACATLGSTYIGNFLNYFFFLSEISRQLEIKSIHNIYIYIYMCQCV